MTLMVNNSSTQSFSQLAYDVYLFDETGAVVDRLLLDFGRLRENRTRIVQFQLERACGRISRLHINGAPECVLENGQSSEFCMDGVIASSRTEIQFGL